jgi:thioredoxin reductase (NADPH)
MHDVAIIGAGPCGLAAAAAVKRRGLTHVVFEKGSVANSIAQYPTYVTFFSTAERVSIAGIPFTIANEKPTRREALAYYRAVVTHEQLDVRQDEAVTAIEPSGADFIVRSVPRNGHTCETRARSVVIATGYFGTPNRLGVPGEDLPHVAHWYREGHDAFQRRALVVGGGNSAAEVSLDLFRHGASVTLVHFGPTFDKNIKPWVMSDLEGRLTDGSIDLRWNTRVVAITADDVHLTTDGHRFRIPADRVFLMTGYTPSSRLLTSLGIRVDDVTGIPDHDPTTMETPLKGVFIAGVLASGNDANKIFIENGRDHGEIIAAALSLPFKGKVQSESEGKG